MLFERMNKNLKSFMRKMTADMKMETYLSITTFQTDAVQLLDHKDRKLYHCK